MIQMLTIFTLIRKTGPPPPKKSAGWVAWITGANPEPEDPPPPRRRGTRNAGHYIDNEMVLYDEVCQLCVLATRDTGRFDVTSLGTPNARIPREHWESAYVMEKRVLFDVILKPVSKKMMLPDSMGGQGGTMSAYFDDAYILVHQPTHYWQPHADPLDFRPLHWQPRGTFHVGRTALYLGSRDGLCVVERGLCLNH